MAKHTLTDNKDETVVVAISMAKRGTGITDDATELVRKTGNGRKCFIVLSV